MTRDELKRCDGREGRKACFAVNGKIYDVTGSPLWVDGDHQGSHQAGSDLTEELKTAPHVRSVIERFPVVGELEEETPQAGSGLRWVVIAAGLLVVGVATVLFFK